MTVMKWVVVSADLTSLAELDKPDKILSAVWALVPSTPPRPPFQTLPTPLPFDMSQIPPSWPALPHAEEARGLPNGSRFARFITGGGGELSLRQQAESENGSPISHLSELQAICCASDSPQIGCRL